MKELKLNDQPPHRHVPDSRLDAILEAMSLEEKAAMLAGIDFWHFRGVPRLGIPPVRVSDCGHGLTLGADRAGQATCLPTGIGMAATWNPELLERAGGVLGREARALGCSVLLGPMINLHRLPVNGRSFETFSEDPWLAGLLGAAVIRGIQAEGVGACVKAMAANSQQQNQQSLSSDVSETALRELYLRTFQLAIEYGDPIGAMTSYNMINGVYPSEDAWLLSGVIKDEWGFPGFIVSDWRAVHSRKALTAGLDIEMPGPGKHMHTKGVLDALDAGLIDTPALDDRVRRLLRLLLAYGEAEEHADRTGLDTPENRATALAVAEESIVLLKNDGALLPLDRATETILVVGPNAAHARLGGGGSASVTPFYSVSPLQGIRQLATGEVRYIEGCSIIGMMEPVSTGLFHRGEDGRLAAGAIAEFYGPDDRETPVLRTVVPEIDFSWGWSSPGAGVPREGYTVRFRGALLATKSGPHRIGVAGQEGSIRFELGGRTVFDTQSETAGLRHENFEDDFQATYHVEELSLASDEPVDFVLEYTKKVVRAAVRLEWEQPGAGGRDELLEAARAADVVIFCGGLSNLIEGGARDRTTLALPPVQDELIAALAEANPRTVVALFNGGPLLMPWEPRVPAVLEAWYPGQEGGRALARLLFGLAEPSGRLPDSIVRQAADVEALRYYPGEAGHSRFGEELFIGYRHLDARNIEPHFPFGFGLGYTDFELGAPVASAAVVTAQDPRLRIEVELRNAGERPGQETVQLYLRRLDAPPERPLRELRAFRKIALEPGAATTVSFELDTRAFEAWDERARAWRVSPGRYQISTGRHSRDLQAVEVEIVTPSE